MPIIETSRMVPSPEEPGKLVRSGQRTYAEVFQDLSMHLADMGYKPDEYLLLDMDLRDGATFPENAYLSHSVGYGGSEGIYLDTAVEWDDDNGSHKKHFFTGKTLATGVEDMNRMNLIASATLFAFHGRVDHSRYQKLGAEDGQVNGLTIHLDMDERDILANALFEARNYQKACGEPYQKTETMLRRVVGSITEYMQLVGKQPTELTAYDATELAIRENNMDVFLAQFPNAPNHGSLFLKAAAQPGHVGEQMTEYLMMGLNDIPYNSYLDACKSIIKNGETERLRRMLNVADDHLAEPYPQLFGVAVKYAYTQYDDNIRGYHIAKALVEHASEDDIKMVPPSVVTGALQHNDTWFADKLLRSGVKLGREAGDTIYAAAAFQHGWFLERMVREHGVDIDANNYAAMRICKNMTNLDAAKVLVDNGADFAGFSEAVANQHQRFGAEQFMTSMGAYSNGLTQDVEQAPAEGQEQTM